MCSLARILNLFYHVLSCQIHPMWCEWQFSIVRNYCIQNFLVFNPQIVRKYLIRLPLCRNKSPSSEHHDGQRWRLSFVFIIIWLTKQLQGVFLSQDYPRSIKLTANSSCLNIICMHTDKWWHKQISQNKNSGAHHLSLSFTKCVVLACRWWP